MQPLPERARPPRSCLPEWSPDGHSIAYAVSPGGGCNAQIHISSLDGVTRRRITAGGNENNFAGEFARESNEHLVAEQLAWFDRYVIAGRQFALMVR